MSTIRPSLIHFALLSCVLLAVPDISSAQRRDPWAEARARLVEYEVVTAGVKDPRVIDAIRKPLFWKNKL